MISIKTQARNLLESVTVLHKLGYGKLKLHCYIKDGLGAWRHTFFISDDFPEAGQVPPKPHISGSLPGWAAASGNTPEEVAQALLQNHVKFFECAKGSDKIYEDWLQNTINTHPVGLLEMEGRQNAKIGSKFIKTPY